MNRTITKLLKNEIAYFIYPLMRGYVRYMPFSVGKHFVLSRIIIPRLGWRSYNFIASTVFGMRLAGNTRDMLQRYIYLFGIWEPHLTYWIKKRLTPGDTFIDIGANIGYYSLLASKLVGEEGRVVAIEASPSIYKMLKNNIKLNNICNVRPVNMAVTDAPGIVQIFRGPDGNIGQATILRGRSNKLECKMDCRPISEILEICEIKTARLIKIDVEGSEWEVLKGMWTILDMCRQDIKIVVELNPKLLASQGKEVQEIIHDFHAAGFHSYRLENDYSALSYVSKIRKVRARRINRPVIQLTDVVFSKEDAEEL